MRFRPVNARWGYICGEFEGKLSVVEAWIGGYFGVFPFWLSMRVLLIYKRERINMYLTIPLNLISWFLPNPDQLYISHHIIEVTCILKS